MGRNVSNPRNNAFWANATTEKMFTLRMRPSKTDLSWYDTFNNTDTTSFAMVGVNNRW